MVAVHTVQTQMEVQPIKRWLKFLCADSEFTEIALIRPRMVEFQVKVCTLMAESLVH